MGRVPRKGFGRLLIAEAVDNGKQAHWTQGYIGPIYTTAINLTILQLDNWTLPIYQRLISTDSQRNNVIFSARVQPSFVVSVPFGRAGSAANPAHRNRAGHPCESFLA